MNKSRRYRSAWQLNCQFSAGSGNGSAEQENKKFFSIVDFSFLWYYVYGKQSFPFRRFLKWENAGNCGKRTLSEHISESGHEPDTAGTLRTARSASQGT
jgi:hypothetical protein